MAVEFFSNPSGVPNVPNGWNVAAIENLCSRVTSGATPLRSNAEYYDAGTIPWIRTQELKDGIIRESAQKITPAALKETSAKLFPVDTVLMAMYGDGKTITSLGILGIEAATNQACCAMITDPTRCLPRFLFYNLRHHRDDIIHIATGGAQRNLSGAIIRRFAISVPPLDEQAVITGILGTLDDKIEQNRKMNETLEAMARALFKSWFVDFDPVRAKAEGRDPGLPAHIASLFPDSFEGSELGEVPTDWKIISLGDFAEVIDCLHSRKPERVEEGLPLLQLGNIQADALLDMTDTYLITSEDYTKWISRMEASPGNCVVTNVGRVGAVAQIPSDFKAALGRNMTGIRCRTAYPFPTYLIQALTSSSMSEEIIRKTDSGTILDSLNVRNIPRLRIIVPPIQILALFEHQCRPIRARMEANLKETSSLATLRDTLLPKLISGGMHVPAATLESTI